MPDPISLITGAIDTVKKLYEVAERVKDADTKMLIADLRVALADIKAEVAALKEQNLRLQSELRQAREKPNVRTNMELRDGLYYLKTAFEGRPEGPYCPRCFDVAEHLVLVTKLTGSFRALGNWTCPNCQQVFG